MTDLHVCVVSRGRSTNVPAMEDTLAGLDPWWYVPDGEGGDYRYAGAARVVEVPWPADVVQLGVIQAPPMVFQRNRALDDGHARGAAVVMTDDDLVRAASCPANGVNVTTPLAVPDLVAELVAHTEQHGLLYGGTPPTANAYFSRRPHTTTGFVRDGLTVHLPNPIRYDTQLPIKIDYDMTLQHLAAHGGALRCDHLLVYYRQRTVGRWGGCDWRSPEVEAACAAYLQAKWGPDVVRTHATRANEVTLRWPS